MVVRFSEDPDIVRDLVHLEEDLERTRRGMMYADDAGIVSKSAEGLAKMMTVIVTVFEAAGLTVSEKSKTMLLRTPDQAPVPHRSSSRQQAKGIQTTQFLYLGGLIDASDDIMPEIKRRVRLAWACHSQFKRELYDMEAQQNLVCLFVDMFAGGGAWQRQQ